MGSRVDVEVVSLGQQLAGQRIHLGDPLDLVAEELDPDDAIVRGRPDLERVAADPEACSLQRLVVALVLQIDQVAEDRVAPVLAALAQPEDRGAVVDRGAEAVDAADAGDDDHVAPLEQGVGRRVAELVDLVVPAGVLLDVGIGAGQVRLGLVVVEVADEVLDRVLREELPEFRVQLGRQRLVVSQHQGRLLVLGDGPGYGRRFARSRCTQERLVAHALGQSVDQTLDRRGLVSGRLKIRDHLELGHRPRIHRQA